MTTTKLMEQICIFCVAKQNNTHNKKQVLPLILTTLNLNLKFKSQFIFLLRIKGVYFRGYIYILSHLPQVNPDTILLSHQSILTWMVLDQYIYIYVNKHGLYNDHALYEKINVLKSLISFECSLQLSIF